MVRVHADDDWRARLRRDGYALFPGLCPQRIVRAARFAIDRDLKTNYDPGRQTEYDHQSYCPALRGRRPLMALLLKSGIAAKLEEVIGFDRLAHARRPIPIRLPGNP